MPGRSDYWGHHGRFAGNHCLSQMVITSYNSSSLSYDEPLLVNKQQQLFFTHTTHVFHATNRHNISTTNAVEVLNMYSVSSDSCISGKTQDGFPTTRICNSSSALVCSLLCHKKSGSLMDFTMDGAWVTRLQHLKGAKDEVKRPEGPPAKKWVLEGTLDF